MNASLRMAALVLPMLATLPATGGAQKVPVIPSDVSEVEAGGYWIQGGDEGSYRIVIQTGGFEHIVSRVWLQWLSRSESQEDTIRVVASRELEEISGDGWRVHSAQLELRDGQWEATLDGANSHSDPTLKARWRVTLGGPGKFTLKVE
jgi:hypothetical protein